MKIQGEGILHKQLIAGLVKGNYLTCPRHGVWDGVSGVAAVTQGALGYQLTCDSLSSPCPPSPFPHHGFTTLYPS